MRIANSLPKLLGACVTLMSQALLVAMPVCAQTTAPQQTAPAAGQRANVDAPKITDTDQSLGSFSIGDQKLAVVAHVKTITNSTNPEFAVTLTSLAIRGMNGSAAYQESFPYDVQDGHFAESVSASASLLASAGGPAIGAVVIRILEESAPGHVDESFQVFGLVDGKLAPYGAPLPLGQAGSGTAVHEVLTGVMVGGGVDVEPLVSTAEVLHFRAWTGNFMVTIPVRVDWAHGRWSEGEECFALTNSGSPSRRGCNLGVAAGAHPPVDGARVTLYTEPVEDHYAMQDVQVRSKSVVVFLGVQALVNWKNDGERFTCTFENLWLHVRIDGKEGWTHTESDFAALGQAASGPPQ